MVKASEQTNENGTEHSDSVDGSIGQNTVSRKRIVAKEQSVTSGGNGNGDRNTTGIDGKSEPKRGRGRPKGSRNKNAAKNTKTVSKVEQKNKSEFIVLMIMGVVVAGGNATFGHDTKFTQIEEQMIKEPLISYLADMDPSNFEMIEGYLNPLMISFGVISWSVRNYRIMSERKTKEKNEGLEVENARHNSETIKPNANDVPSVSFNGFKST